MSTVMTILHAILKQCTSLLFNVNDNKPFNNKHYESNKIINGIFDKLSQLWDLCNSTQSNLFRQSIILMNIILLLLSIIYYAIVSTKNESEFGIFFATRSFYFSLSCVILVLILYFWKIERTTKRVEAMNLDIFGVINAATNEDIDLFQRFLKRASHMVHEQRHHDFEISIFYYYISILYYFYI